MHEKYITLFTKLAQSIEVLSEQVLDYNKSKNDEHGAETAGKMRQQYADLHDKLAAKDFDPSNLTKADYGKLLIGAVILSNNLEDQIKTLQTAMHGYKIDVIPKLQRIANETKNDLGAINLASQLFNIDE